MTSEIVKDLLIQSNKIQSYINYTISSLEEQEKNPKVSLDILLAEINYHKTLVDSIKEIIKLTKEEKEKISLTKEVVEELEKTKPYFSGKILEGISILNEVDFIPENLNVCPKCGRFFNEGKCIKYEVIVNNKVLGYSYKCEG